LHNSKILLRYIVKNYNLLAGLFIKLKKVPKGTVEDGLLLNRDIFIDFFLIIAYNIDEQEYLLDLSVLLL